MKNEFGMFSKKVTFVSFLMQLGIVMVHMNTDHYFDVSTSEGFLNWLCQWIARLCSDGGVVSLSFFMICSAFLLYYNLTKENMMEKLRRRFVSLLMPFIIWNVIGMIFCAVYWWNTEDFYAIFSYIPFQFVMSRYCAVMWFSQALLFFLLFVPVILWLMRKKVIGELVLFLTFACGYTNWEFLGKNFLNQYIDFEIVRFLSYVPVYFLGAYLGVRFSKEIISETYHSRIIKIAAGILWVISYALPGGLIAYILRTIRPLYLWVIIDKRWLYFELKWWMDNNFFIYATHYFLILAIVPLLCKIYSYVPASDEFVTFWRFVCFAFITLICEMMGWLLIKFVPKAYSLLTGGRVPKL